MEPHAPIPEPPTPRRARLHPGVVAVGLAVVLAAAGATAWALAADDAPAADAGQDPAGHDHEEAGADHDHDTEGDASRAGARRRDGGRRHHHPRLAPYEERYADASEDQQEAADDLLNDVRESLSRYADVDAATAAGYEPAADARGPIVHYANRGATREQRQHGLDPDRPFGLVYGDDPDGQPVLLGAFFVVPRGTPAPQPAGDLVVWHSHSPSCPAFFVAGAEDCMDTRRMLHVWTADQVELTSRRTGEPVEVRVTDPFGAPFTASVERAE